MKEDPEEDTTKLFEEYLDECPEFVEGPIKHDEIEDISIKLSQDYTTGLKEIKDTVKEDNFKSRATTNILEQETRPWWKVSSSISEEKFKPEQHLNLGSYPQERTKQEGKNIMDHHVDDDHTPSNEKGKLLTQCELLEKMLTQFESKNEVPWPDKKQETTPKCNIRWTEKKGSNIKKKKGTEEKGNLIPQHDLFGKGNSVQL